MHNSPVGGNISVMTPRLRTLIDHASRLAESDAVLLRKFADARDPQAFAELVRRYGRLVWGQCRHLLHSEVDADDAFQATFLSLAKCGRTLRDTNKLGPWLHGVAYRVCQQVKRTAARRTKREKATAKAEATRPVPDSAWDTAFAAVHEELAKLPDTLRVPFVLCVLEGKGTTEAATQLGLKLGTLSARLSRAKQTLLDRLSARGLTAGLAAVGAVAVGASSAPAAVVGRACDFAAGATVPPNILSLSHGVLNMVTLSAKRWAMAAVLACGLAAGGAGVWQANAQEKPAVDKAKDKVDVLKKYLHANDPAIKAAEDDLKKLEAEAQLKKFDAAKAADELKKAQADAEKAVETLKRATEKADQAYDLQARRDPMSGKLPPSPAPEFKYFGQGAGYSPTAAEFEATVKKVEGDGYTFVGVVTMKGQTKAKDNEAVPTLVFRRTPAKNVAVEGSVQYLHQLLVKENAKPHEVPKLKPAETPAAADAEKTLKAEVDRLTRELAALKAKEKKPTNVEAVIDLKEVGGEFETVQQLVKSLVRVKFGADAASKLTFELSGGRALVGGGTEDQMRWLVDTVSALKANKPK